MFYYCNALSECLCFNSQADIFSAFGELFQAATSRPAPYGIGDYPSSRAIYAIDLMLKWDKTEQGNTTNSFKNLQAPSGFNILACMLYHRYVWLYVFMGVMAMV